jgi:nucleoside-diphosphate-sugar epimerase
MKKVGIIGGSGFIGSYITKIFLDNNFEVKVSATNILKEEKYKHLMKLSHADRLYISELNVTNKEALTDFVKDCDIVIHGGTPFILEFKNAQTELFEPTIKGTENFLEVVSNTTSIEKVVFIASVAAWNTNFPMPADGKTVEDTFSEEDIPFISKESHPYAQAKFIANQTVENFIKNNPNINFEITTVAPVSVMGKAMSNREDSTSVGLQFLFKNKIASNPFVQMLYDTNAEFAMVNVKDIAKGVYKAATTHGLHGKNYLLSSETYPVSDISLMLNNKKPINEAKVIYQNKLAKQELGIQFQTIIETLKEFNS